MTAKIQKKSTPKKPKKKTPTRGKDLFNYVVQLTGLPKEKIMDELKTILNKKNIEISQLTVDQLRVVVASYLREIMTGIMDHIPHKPRGNEH